MVKEEAVWGKLPHKSWGKAKVPLTGGDPGKN